MKETRDARAEEWLNEINLKDIKAPTIVTGFPGYGLVGTIVTQYLIEHLKTEKIGSIALEEISPIIAIHEGKAVEPLSLHYNKKYNLLILHAITSVGGIEWKVAKKILALADVTSAKEMMCVEGVGTTEESDEHKVYFFAADEKVSQSLKKYGAEPLKEGYIIGIIPALLLKSKAKVSCIFAQTHTQYPDSHAAAKIVEILDKHMSLNVDYEPLIDMAKKFEEQIKNIVAKGQNLSDLADKKRLSYVG